MSSRRKFIQNVAMAGVATSLLPENLLAKTDHADKNRSLRVAHITDVHMCNKPQAETFFTQVMKEINSMTDKPDLIINTGDTVMDENKQNRQTVEQHWNSWNKIVSTQNKITMKSALGNHDVWYGPDEKLDAEYKADKRYGKQWAMEILRIPNRYYAFEQNGWKFIALDSINGESGYQLDETQVNWLEDELKKTNKNIPVCVFSHVPVLSMGALMYLTQRNPISEVKFPSGDMHNDHQRIKNIFTGYSNIKLCLSGHVHYIDGIDYLGVKYLCNGAVSGNWWGNPLSLDEFPPVYTIIDLYKDGSIHYEHVFYTNKI